MQTERREAEMQQDGTAACPSCRAVLVPGMRFCRMCGYRLGEGLEEYVPTQRLGAPPPTATAPGPAPDPFAQRAAWGAAPMQPMQPQGLASSSTWGAIPAPKRAGWWTWIIIACLIMVGVGIGGKVLKTVLRGDAGDRGNEFVVTNSLIDEADGFETADGGGAFIEGLAGPNSSWERAGLIGGDIITGFDLKPIGDERDLRRAIALTPPGKPVEVTFIRDNVQGKTTLTPGDKREWRGMDPIEDRPGGRGVLGVDVGRRVRVPAENIYGVELGSVHNNRPADLAGLQKGDIVVEFNDKLIRTPGDLRLRIYEAAPNSIVNVTVIRDGRRVVIPVKLGKGRSN